LPEEAERIFAFAIYDKTEESLFLPVTGTG
jgi:asparagine synthetase B (glutamine-hydrolysing)